MKKLDVIKYEFRGGKMVMIWHRCNTENVDNDAAGVWYALKELTKEQVKQFADMHVDADIEVSVVGFIK